MAAEPNRADLIRSWIMAGDRPSLVVVTDSKGTNTRCSYKHGTTWIGFARTLDALDPVRIQCFDAENNLLKATTISELEKGDAEEREAEVVEPVSIVDTTKMTGAEQMLTRFGELLAAAYDGSNARAWETAFAKMAEVCEIFAKRAESLETRLARMESMVARATNDALQNQGEGDLLTQIVGAYAQGAAAAHGGVPPAKPNGKGKEI